VLLDSVAAKRGAFQPGQYRNKWHVHKNASFPFCFNFVRYGCAQMLLKVAMEASDTD
jgi:hypothetical protein